MSVLMKGLNRMKPPYSLVILTSLLAYSTWTLSHPITAACVECSSTYAENEEAPSVSEHSTKSASVLGVVVGESNIKDVEAKLGASPIIDTGDGAMPDVMCFKAATQGDDTILVFKAGPLGAFEKITGIEIRTGISSKKLTLECPTSAHVSRALCTDDGICMNMNEEQLSSLLGGLFPENVEEDTRTRITVTRTETTAMTENEIRSVETLWDSVRNNPYWIDTTSQVLEVRNKQLEYLLISKTREY